MAYDSLAAAIGRIEGERSAALKAFRLAVQRYVAAGRLWEAAGDDEEAMAAEDVVAHAGAAVLNALDALLAFGNPKGRKTSRPAAVARPTRS